MLEQLGFRRFDFPEPNGDYSYFLNKPGTFIAYKTPKKASVMEIDLREDNPLKIANMDKESFYSLAFSHLIPFPRLKKPAKGIIKPKDIQTIITEHDKPFSDTQGAVYRVFYNALRKKENHKYKEVFLDKIGFPRTSKKRFCTDLERIIDLSLQSLDAFFENYAKQKAEIL